MSNSNLRFTKVNHPGCHQDYRIIWMERHIGNIRAGFKKGQPCKLRTFEWTARSDVGGMEITVHAEQPRFVVAMKLLMCLQVLDAGLPSRQIMQTTKDVGHDEEKPRRRTQEMRSGVLRRPVRRRAYSGMQHS